MIRNASVMLVVLACLPAWGGQTRYDLGKSPKFRPGDSLTYTLTGRSGSAILSKERKVLQNESRTRSDEIAQEVLAVDDDGQVTSLRITIKSASETTSSTAPAAEAFNKTVALKDIIATAGLNHGRFDVDTTTVASVGPQAQKPSASQIALLKRVVSASATFRAYDPGSVALLPRGPLAVGDTWVPADAAMEAWATQNPIVRGMNATVADAQFKLIAVDDGLADIRGVVRLRAPLMGQPVEPIMKLTFTVHVPSGRWLSESVYLALAVTLKNAHLIVEGRHMGAAAFVAGDGKPTPPPRDTHALGWPAPPKDANSFQDALHGVSLDLPKDFRPQVPGGGDTIAAFACDDGGHVAVSLRTLPGPVDMDELLPKVLAGLQKSVPQFRLQDKTALSLPGNVPAVLIIGRGMGGQAQIVRLIAIDDRRVVSVIAAAPTDNPQLLAELTRIARTLRVLEPKPEAQKPVAGSR